MNLVKGYLGNIVNPLLRDLLKSYCQLMKNDKFDCGDMRQSLSSEKGFKSSANLSKYIRSPQTLINPTKNGSTPHLSYPQRLSPLLYSIINYTQYHQNRTSSDN